MFSKVAFIALFLLSVDLCFSQRHPGRRPPKNRPCCKTFNHENIRHKVNEDTYRTQEALGSCKKAIILSINNGEVCVNPNDHWVKNFIANMTNSP